ncbi:MAG TPA: hypothetical protein VFQ38_04125 [Longimicrobiales bacterium]|nr:hypothetical protein [Longimicrobiales bacterium]
MTRPSIENGWLTRAVLNVLHQRRDAGHELPLHDLQLAVWGPTRQALRPRLLRALSTLERAGLVWTGAETTIRPGHTTVQVGLTQAALDRLGRADLDVVLKQVFERHGITLPKEGRRRRRSTPREAPAGRGEG